MPEVQEVFRMATQKVKPDPGALDRQHGEQRRRTIRRRMGVYGLVAAIVVAIAIVAVSLSVDTTQPFDQPSSSAPTLIDVAAPVGTVTLDGSTCSVQMSADQIEAGVVTIDVVNATKERAMFDSWELLDGYTVEEFERVVERYQRIFESGREFPEPGFFPDEDQVRYFSSEIIPANGSGTIVRTMLPGTHAITCLERYEGEGFLPTGTVGPFNIR
jgi:hypothetical protein